MKKHLFILCAALFAAAVSCEKAPTEPSRVPVTSVSLDQNEITMGVGEYRRLTSTVSPSDATDKSVSWSSSNEAVATVTSGTVTAVAAGSATITVTTADQGKTATCAVEVTKGIGAVTGAATHISCRNAEISGKANISGTMTTDLSFGVLYNTSSGVLIGTSTQVEAKSFDKNYNFTVNTEVLEPETTYYYRSYIIQNKEITYGEVKSFKTLAVSSLIQTAEATEINPKDAVLNATLDLTDCKYDGVEYGFEVTPKGGTTYTIKSTKHYPATKISVKDETLAMGTQYSFIAYVTLDGRTYKGETKSFTTPTIKASVTAEASNISYFTATISGKLTVTSGEKYGKTIALYHSSTAATIEELKASGTKQKIALNSDGTYSVLANGLAYNSKNYYCVVAEIYGVELATSVNNLTTKALPTGSVNLGLSVKWASCNIGASKPEEYGKYFAWGDVTGQTWNGSSWSGGGFGKAPASELDENKNLKPEYDAAHVILGGTWRMPTYAEYDELLDNCTLKWVTINGVNGMLATSKKKGYTDKSIFLPAAGSGQISGMNFAGSRGFYLSRTSDTSDTFAMGFYFRSDYSEVKGLARGDGNSIRPVSE